MIYTKVELLVEQANSFNNYDFAIALGKDGDIHVNCKKKDTNWIEGYSQLMIIKPYNSDEFGHCIILDNEVNYTKSFLVSTTSIAITQEEIWITLHDEANLINIIREVLTSCNSCDVFPNR